MEMAAAAGIIIVGKDLRPLDATTYGVGEMIKDAIAKGCRNLSLVSAEAQPMTVELVC